jgi:phage major head subunit gpT-like protein
MVTKDRLKCSGFMRKFKAQREVANGKKTKNIKPAHIKVVHSLWDEDTNNHAVVDKIEDNLDESDINE